MVQTSVGAEEARASWPARLPWPLAVLFIFVLGVALWWGVFHLADALLG